MLSLERKCINFSSFHVSSKKLPFFPLERCFYLKKKPQTGICHFEWRRRKHGVTVHSRIFHEFISRLEQKKKKKWRIYSSLWQHTFSTSRMASPKSAPQPFLSIKFYHLLVRNNVLENLFLFFYMQFFYFVLLSCSIDNEVKMRVHLRFV